jgi:histidinol-phosphate aminotransferase
MLDRISKAAQQDALERGYTRRHLARIAGMLAAGAPLFSEAMFAQEPTRTRSGRGGGQRVTPPDAVRIDLNEYPDGPHPDTVQAVAEVARYGNRYRPRHEHQDLVDAVAQTEGLKTEYISLGIGSSDPLQAAAIAFTSPTRPLVTADPVYESAGRAAEKMGVKVYRIPLRTTDYTHDVRAMIKADPNAGAYYVCSPNNPTGTMTSFDDLKYLLDNKPKGSVLILDEAYVQFAIEHSPAIEWVAADKDIVVLRTFSKIYSMAGLRMGMALARPDLLQKMRPWSASLLPITGIVAATASLKVKDLRATPQDQSGCAGEHAGVPRGKEDRVHQGTEMQ